MHRLKNNRVKATCICVFLIAGVSILGGCASLWQPAKGAVTTSSWSVFVPDGWMRLTSPAYDMFSKDGPYLQYVLIQESALGQGFRFTRKRIDESMLPHEMAQVVIDNLKADPEIGDFQIEVNAPAIIGGKPGFKLIYTYLDRQGVSMKTIYFGTASGSNFVNFRYTAAQRHYFAASLDTFEKMRKSFQILPTTAS